MVLAGAGVLGLLHHHRGGARQFAGQAHRPRDRGVAGGAPLEAFDLAHRFGRPEGLALAHREVAVHVAQRARRVARHVRAIGPRREGHAEPGVSGGEALAVEIRIAGHVQAAQVDRDADDLGLGRPGPLEAARRPRRVAAAGVGDHAVRRRRPGERRHLLGDLDAEGLDTRDAERRVQRGGEVAGLVEQLEHEGEELGADAQLHDFGAVGLADAALLEDLGLPDVAAVEGLLADDALESSARRLAADGGAVVARGRGDDAVVALLPGQMDADAGPAILEGAGEIRGLVLDEDPRAPPGLAHRPDEVGQVPELEQRRLADARARLDGDDLRQAVAMRGHHAPRSRRRSGSARRRRSPCRGRGA